MAQRKKKRTRRTNGPRGQAVAFRLTHGLIADINTWSRGYRLSRNKLVDLVLRHIVDGKSSEDLYKALDVFKQENRADDDQPNLFA